MSDDPTGAAPAQSQQPAPEAGAPAPDAPAARPGAHPVLVYTLLRILVLAVTGGLLYLLGMRGVWLLLFAFLLSGIASIFVLDRRREAAAGGVVEVVHKVNQRIDSSASAEDDVAAPRAARAEVPADDDLDDLEPGDRPS